MLGLECGSHSLYTENDCETRNEMKYKSKHPPCTRPFMNDQWLSQEPRPLGDYSWTSM